jgi:hypothetical protein
MISVHYRRAANTLAPILNPKLALTPQRHPLSSTSTSSIKPSVNCASLRPNPFYSPLSYSFSSTNLPKLALDQLLSHPYARLCRWDKPIGALLLYWPCLWGIEAGAHGLLLAQSTTTFIQTFSLSTSSSSWAAGPPDLPAASSTTTSIKILIKMSKGVKTGPSLQAKSPLNKPLSFSSGIYPVALSSFLK